MNPHFPDPYSAFLARRRRQDRAVTAALWFGLLGAICMLVMSSILIAHAVALIFGDSVVAFMGGGLIVACAGFAACVWWGKCADGR